MALTRDSFKSSGDPNDHGFFVSLEKAGFTRKNLRYPIEQSSDDTGDGQYIVFYAYEVAGTAWSKDRTNTKINTAKFKEGEFKPGADMTSQGRRFERMFDHERKTASGGPRAGTKSHRATTTAIVLYMPDAITATYGIDWSPVSGGKAVGAFESIGKLTGETGKAAREVMQGEFKKAFGTQTEGIVDFLQQNSDVPLEFARNTIAALAGEGTQGVAELTGKGSMLGERVIGNPNIMFLFKQTQARSFVYNFRFAPRNQAEVDAVKQIIKEFKFFAHPEIVNSSPGTKDGKDSFFIRYPSEFGIQYVATGKQNAYLNKIGRCALTNITVNYSAGGIYNTFAESDAPVMIDLGLTFQELSLLTKADIDGGF